MMKKNVLIIAILALFMSMGLSLKAQAPYKHSIGATLGSMEAFSWKMFPTNHFAFQLDAGSKFTVGAADNYSFNVYTAEVNANFMFQGHFTKGLYGFVGGGPSLGYCWNAGWNDNLWGWNIHSHSSDCGKFGANVILGLEYKFNFPMTMQFDFRPGYGILFNENWDASYFDWGLNFGVRYAF